MIELARPFRAGLAVGWVLGCWAGGFNSVVGQSTRDSAGITIIDNRAPAWGAARASWRIGAKPILVIGEDEGAEPYLLNRVSSALRLPDGRIIIANSGAHQLQFFGADGKFIRAAGRRGGGPGEFAPFSAIQVCLISSTELVASDPGLRRAHIFSLGGEYKRTISFQTASGASAPEVRSCYADGTFLTINVPISSIGGAQGALIPEPMEYYRYGASGRAVAKLATVSGRTRYGNDTRFSRQLPHYPYIPFSPEPHGAAASRVTYINQGGKAEVQRRGPNGKLEALVRWDAARPKSAGVYARWVKADLAATNERSRQQYAAFYAVKLPVPEQVPAVGHMIVDADDHLWVRRYPLPWDVTAIYEVFDPSGRWLGQVKAPPRLDVYQIGRDFLLGRQRDGLGVERLAIYSLERGQ